MTVFKVREAIVDTIPKNLRYSISVGIGLFIAFIGLKNGGIIVANNSTITGLGEWTASSTLAVIGIALGAVLLAVKVRGALFYTIIALTIIGIPLGVTQIPADFTVVSLPASMEPVAMKVDFSRFLSFDVNYYIAVATLLFMDLFDTIGTLIGASTGAGMVDKETGKIPDLNKALMADAVGTTVGALCGTSTVTTYVESTTGIAEGGRTGLTAATVAGLFLVSMFLSPVFLVIPSAATTSALVLVGVMMLSQVVHLDFKDFTESVPAFLTILMMPFASSVSEGIVMGLLSYVIIKMCTGRFSQLSVTMYVLAALFLLKYVSALL
jgi:AGZA family xanthine/uracil permease-like MFS transporter